MFRGPEGECVWGSALIRGLIPPAAFFLFLLFIRIQTDSHMPGVTFSYKMYSKVFIILLHCSLHTLIYQGVFLLNFIQLTYVTPGWWWVFKEVVSCKSSLNCRGPKSQPVCVIIVVHAASLPKTKCSSCPTCVSARAVLSPQLYGLLTAGVTALSVESLNPTDLFLFVSFFHINSVKTKMCL